VVILLDIPVWIPMYGLIVGCLIWRLGWKKGLIMTLAAAATFGFCDQFSNIIKDLVGRIRPLNDAYMLENGLNVLEGASRSFSFFSAHSANAFGLATSTLIGFRLDKRLKYKGYAVWMYFWATMVAFSRIFVGKHYLGDILAGALIGAVAGFAFASIARIIITRYIK
jgi:undecaprenyl-diphosphatase